MKKNFILWSLFVAVLTAMCSCSSSSTDDLLSRVPSDSEIVIVGDVKTVFESAGGRVTDTRIVIPSWLSEMTDGVNSSEELELANDFIRNSGVNLDACVFTMKFNWNAPLVIFRLDDRKKFVNYIEDKKFNEFDEKDGVVFFKQEESDWSSYVGLKDSYAYWVQEVSGDRSFKPVKDICRIIDDAKDAPFSKTSMAKYIADNVLGVSVKMPAMLLRELRSSGFPASMLDLYDGYLCIKGALDSDDVKIEAKMFDEEGKTKNLKGFADMIDLNGRISSKALSFMGKNESLVFASCLKDVNWDKYFDLIALSAHLSGVERRQFRVVQDYLNNIDGTIACGFGVTNGLESFVMIDRNRDVLQQIAVTIVVETKDDKAKRLMSDLEDLLEMASIPYEGSIANGFKIDIPGENAAISIASEGNFIVFSNHKIKRGNNNATVREFDFSDYIGAMALYLDKDNRLMKDLGLKNDVLFSYYGDSKDMEMTMELKVKGGAGAGVIEKIGNMILTASKTDFSAYYPWSVYDQTDEVVVEEIAVDDYDF